MLANIVSIGTELILGQTVDSNAVWLAQRLASLGIACRQHVTVADDRRAIADAMAMASRGAELVLVTGGLGPTPDDLTRLALADALGTELQLHQPSLDHIAAFFRGRGLTMTEANGVQAMFPGGTTPIENTCGTAPGIHARLNEADIYVMPGVPREMRVMFDRDIRPVLEAAGGGGVILSHRLECFGTPEAEIGEKLADMMAPDRNPSVGTSADDWVISVRINATGGDAEAARALLDADAAEIRRRLGRAIFGEQGQTLADAVARLLIDQGKTVSTAESCTGGLIAKRLTDVPGSSAYMVQGYVAYANAAKHRLLGVRLELIEAHGAVSREVVETMACGCRRLAVTDYALAVTGIAGPSGGTAQKPVGLVYLALAGPERTTVKELRCGESLSREVIRDRTAKAALNLLRLGLLCGS